MPEKDFWDKKHANSEVAWLTGSPAHEIVSSHKIKINANVSVLEIGVGIGKFITWCSKVTKNTYASDISSVALDNIKHLNIPTYLVDNLKDVPPVDIAICHLVFQHCNNEQISHILNNVNLKSDGIITFQFADLITTSESLNSLIQDGSHYFRTVDQMKLLVESSNKQFLSLRGPDRYTWNNARIDWYFFKCKQRSIDVTN